MRLSIYNLLKSSSGKTVLKDFIIDNYKDLPVEGKILKKDDIVGYRKAMMFYQEFTRQQPEWITKTNDLLHDPFESDEYEQKEIRAVIILQINRRYFALSFNSGISMIKSEFVNYDFGFEVAKKLLDDKKISGYYSTDISERIINTNKNSTHFIPTHVINDRRKLSAVNSISGGGSGEIKTKITGRYNLVVNFNKDLKTKLIPYLTNLSNIYFNDSHPGVSISTGLTEIKDPSEIDFLDNSFTQDIISWSENLFSKGNLPNQFPSEPISFNINHQILEDHLLNYSIDGLGLNSDYTFSAEELNPSVFFDRFCYYISQNQNNESLDTEYILNKLKRDNIYLISDDEKIKISNIYNSLIVKYPLSQKDSEKEAVLISGKWFSLSKNYYVELEDIINGFTNQYQDISLPGYSVRDKNELAYNKRVAEIKKLKLFDEFWYTYPQSLRNSDFNSSSRIEPCDLLRFEKNTDTTKQKLVLFHIKRGGSAQGISHLTTQGETSANLLFDDKARISFVEYMNSKYEDLNIPTDIKPEETTIVLGITQKKHRAALRNTLTLLQLNALSRCLTNIRAKGFKVSLNIIPDNSK